MVQVLDKTRPIAQALFGQRLAPRYPAAQHHISPPNGHAPCVSGRVLEWRGRKLASRLDLEGVVRFFL